MDEIASDKPLVVKPGEYAGVLTHGTEQAVFHITLDGDRPSGQVDGLSFPESGRLHDKERGVFGERFPSYEMVACLRGDLRNNLPIALIDARLMHWLSGQAYFGAETALVGPALTQAPDLRFRRLRFQTEGLAEMIGIGAIHTRLLDPTTGQPADQIVIRRAENQVLEWDLETGHVEAGFQTRASGYGDPFHFEVSSSPYVEVTSHEPLDWATWWTNWVQPVQDLVCLSGRAARSVTWAMLQIERPSPSVGEKAFDSWSSAQVFGHGIKQASHTVEGRWRQTPLFQLHPSIKTLPDLVTSWHAVRDRHRAFLETYMPVLHGAAMTELAQFMFLVIGAEALHAGLHGTGERPMEDHSAERAAIIGKVKAATVLTDRELKFLKRYLSKRNDFSLADRLRSLVKDLGKDIAARPEFRSLADEVPDLRNTVAHGRVLSPKEIAMVRRTIKPLRALLDGHLLSLLDLPVAPLVARLDEEGE